MVLAAVELFTPNGLNALLQARAWKRQTVRLVDLAVVGLQLRDDVPAVSTYPGCRQPGNNARGSVCQPEGDAAAMRVPGADSAGAGARTSTGSHLRGAHASAGI
ncbi:hypothetical protein [Kitasatospora sp. NPDC085879]|uniref:hypothetical protein n=1 Tax=Kitasatospora sp. NPDC085879 TaxID=3154769 RepID=UPI00343CFB75